MGDDVRDILEWEGLQSGSSSSVSKEAIIGSGNKKKKTTGSAFKRPEGMARELYALLYSENKDIPSLAQSSSGSGYKQNKAQLGRSRVREWKWMAFTNLARNDGAILHHWRRKVDGDKPYPFSKFNKTVDVPMYTTEEYKYLQEEYPTSWSKEETDYLFDLCRRFDLRFPIIHDQYNTSDFSTRSIEALKDHYYSVCRRLAKVRGLSGEQVSQACHFDAQHETDRKAHLEKLFARTQEQVDEEEYLSAELKRIDQRKKEREKKQQDLQKIIAAADNTERQMTRTPKKAAQKKKAISNSSSLVPSLQEEVPSVVEVAPKSVEKSGGVYVRSIKLKMQASLGQKKTKVIEALLEEFGIGLNPMPTEQVCNEFAELRNDLSLLLDLKTAADSCEYEVQTLRHRYEGLTPERDKLPASIRSAIEPFKPSSSGTALHVIDMAMSGPSASGTQRKRRAAALEHNSNQYKKSRRF
ncbi:DNA methyltransferase 1-associated protein 1-like isoform X2 [Corticium candelabrum]|uniref:DNA methyltransferase 1-associated protein 1-like isoform X2 n=1 Tax=Corticium candelabrum TaxID=121492 RepID=UPI002E26A8F3|nr:DNA methyltransferase 1-associated protein 1-like isoform X2 [Corticium candelabrum]